MKNTVRPLIDHVPDPSLPRLIEIYAVDAGEKIDRNRRFSKADELFRVRKIALADSAERCTKCRQRRIRRARVRRIGLDKNI